LLNTVSISRTLKLNQNEGTVLLSGITVYCTLNETLRVNLEVNEIKTREPNCELRCLMYNGQHIGAGTAIKFWIAKICDVTYKFRNSLRVKNFDSDGLPTCHVCSISHSKVILAKCMCIEEYLRRLCYPIRVKA
jgi:hypothetical protein